MEIGSPFSETSLGREQWVYPLSFSFSGAGVVSLSFFEVPPLLGRAMGRAEERRMMEMPLFFSLSLVKRLDVEAQGDRLSPLQQ